MSLIFGDALLEWREPVGARYRLLQASGGLRRLFILDLVTDGLPITLFLCGIWLVALWLGAKVMNFYPALLLFIAFAVAVAGVQSLLLLLTRTVRVTTRELCVGMRRWRTRAIRGWSWDESFPNMEFPVLAVRLGRGILRIALAPELQKKTVEEALEASGIRRL